MNEGVITKTTGLKYFNTVMLDLLKQSECMSEEQEALLLKYNDQIGSFKPFEDNDLELQKEIFSTKLFREFKIDMQTSRNGAVEHN